MHASVANFRALWTVSSLFVNCVGKQYGPPAVFERRAHQRPGDTPSRASRVVRMEHVHIQRRRFHVITIAHEEVGFVESQHEQKVFVSATRSRRALKLTQQSTSRATLDESPVANDVSKIDSRLDESNTPYFPKNRRTCEQHRMNKHPENYRLFPGFRRL